LSNNAIPKSKIDRYWNLRREGKMSPERAAKEAGFSAATAYRLERSIKSSTPATRERKKQEGLPNPRSWEELSPDPKEALRDINVFCELYFARRPSPWRYDAAMRTVELLQAPEKEFIVANVFPGIGKTTFWTHDLPAWLVAGGGVLDPSIGRAIRIMIGAFGKKVSTHNVMRLRRTFDLRRPFYDKTQRREAEAVMAIDFGRFRPDAAAGEESVWTQDQFLVAQLGEYDVYEKEPTVQAASRESGFLGERVDLAVWDDLANRQNSHNPEIADALGEWVEDEAETRVEPGGLFTLVGQRLSALDIYRNRLDKRELADDGVETQVYHHVVYPAHNEETCDGSHRQWDLKLEGCLTDETRFNSRDLVRHQTGRNFRTVYQQEDNDPGRILVLPLWLDGGTDPDGYDSPGCWDDDREFFQHPKGVGDLVNYCVVDPSVSGWWAIEWWAIQPQTKVRYLIAGWRKRLKWGEFLDWDPLRSRHVGLMNQVQDASIAGGQPIRVWVVEQVSAFKGLFQFEHFRTWKLKNPFVSVIPHETQRNKNDEHIGVDALMPMIYRSGMKRLPRAGVDARNYLHSKIHELTNYPNSTTYDTVMADWMGEANIEGILRLGRRQLERFEIEDVNKLPPYLRRQAQEIRYA